jgi:hypothetical protein
LYIVNGVLSIPRRVPLYSMGPPSVSLITKIIISCIGREQPINIRDNKELKIALRKNGSLE